MSPYRTIIKMLLNNPLSISELQTIVPVSLPTLRKTLQELAEAHWIRVTGQSEANGGRPAMLFGPDESYYLIIGVHLQLPGIRLVSSDLTGQILDADVDFANIVPEPNEVIQRIESYVAEIVDKYPDRQVLGVGIASPGFIDPVSGDILTIGRVENWQNVPICQRLRTSLGLPVYTANDVDCMAFAEFQHSRTSFDNNLVYVGFDEGVKVSMFLNGQLYKGSFGNAGLIVTQLLNADEISASVQGRDILTIRGISEMFDEQMRSLDEPVHVQYADITNEQNMRQRLQRIFEYSDQGLPVCRHVTKTLIQTLVAAITNVTYLIQPDTLVLGGVLSTMPPTLYAELELAIRQSLPSLFTNALTIRQANLSSPNRAALGANYHFLQTYLIDSNVNLILLPREDSFS